MPFDLTPTNTIKPSYIREILMVTKQRHIISLAGGLPDQQLFPMAIIEQSLDIIKKKASLFQYGNTQGYRPLLEFLKQSYLKSYQDYDALVCTGSQQGLDLVVRAYIKPGDDIVIEAPSYLGALQIFEFAQANLHSIASNNDNELDLHALETTFQQNRIKFFYAVPDFNNPTGRCWSLHTRKKVADLCKQYQVYLIEDVPYRDLRFKGDALPLMSELHNQTITLRSFSKIAAPGIRLGCVFAQKNVIEALITIKQAADLHSNLPMQAALLEILTNPMFNSHLDEVRTHYKYKQEVMIKAINTHLNGLAQAQAVNGGMFIWLMLLNIKPHHVETFARSLLNKAVAVVPSNVFYPQNFPTEQQQSGLRLNFTHASPNDIEQAIKIIADELSTSQSGFKHK